MGYICQILTFRVRQFESNCISIISCRFPYREVVNVCIYTLKCRRH